LFATISIFDDLEFLKFRKCIFAIFDSLSIVSRQSGRAHVCEVYRGPIRVLRPCGDRYAQHCLFSGVVVADFLIERFPFTRGISSLLSPVAEIARQSP
jgi:hypothetical protein